jgi:RNA polymerase sigma factor (sigma-70 family)
MIVETQQEVDASEWDRLSSFERTLLPHMYSAHNLAHWIIGNHQDADDMVKEAYWRALRSFESFRGGDGRSWLLTIVRNTCYTWLRQNRSNELTTAPDEQIEDARGQAPSPEALLLQSAANELVKNALEGLALDFREVLILRELEGLSYKEIAAVAGIPIGTVMSRLARARKHLGKYLRKSSYRRQSDESASEVGFVP